MKVKNKLSVSNERLRIVGKLIGVYREERRDNSQNCWTQKRFCKDICSPNTLKSIEAGGLARSLDVYMEMLDKFDLKLGEFLEIDKAIYKLTEELYEAIEYYNSEEIEKITKKVIRILSEVSNYLYYCDLYDLFVDLKRYYLEDCYIDYKRVERYTLMINSMPSIFKDFYRILVFAKMKPENTSTKSDIERLVKSIQLDKSEHIFTHINLLQYFFIMENYKMMDDVALELEEYFESHANLIRLLDVLNYAIVLKSYIAMNECEVYILKVNDLIKSKSIPLLKIGEAYANIGLAYYVNKHYDNALLYFNEMRNYPFQNSLDKFILMADCQNRLDKKIEIPIVEEKDFLKFPLEIKLMYKYFTLNDDIPFFVKENYIIKKVLNNLIHDVYIDIFRFELLKLVEKTTHYKMLHIFDFTVKDIKS